MNQGLYTYSAMRHYYSTGKVQREVSAVRK